MKYEQKQSLLNFFRPVIGVHCTPDGIWGPNSIEATKAFQRAYGLAADGVWGLKTEAKIRQAIASSEKPKIQPQKTQKPIEKIYVFLKEKGLSKEAIAGIMGNIDCESKMNPTNMEDQFQSRLGFNDFTYTAATDNGIYKNFVHDACGYGLCQWTWWTRKQGLLHLAQRTNRSVGDLNVQLEWLWQELETKFQRVLIALRQPDISVYEATEIFMKQYEAPADTSPKAVARRVSASDVYYSRIKGR